METLLTLSRTVAVALLVGGGLAAHGQMLGTPAAEVLLGRPLDMTVPARFASADSGDECVQADVFYGEHRIKAGSVRALIRCSP